MKQILKSIRVILVLSTGNDSDYWIWYFWFIFILLQGVAINFVKNDDIRILRDIEQYYSTQIDEMPMNGEMYFRHNRVVRYWTYVLYTLYIVRVFR